jgi:hypothetical protein
LPVLDADAAGLVLTLMLPATGSLRHALTHYMLVLWVPKPTAGHHLLATDSLDIILACHRL